MTYMEIGEPNRTALRHKEAEGSSGASNPRQGDALDTQTSQVTRKEGGHALEASHHTQGELPLVGLHQARPQHFPCPTACTAMR